MPMKRTTPSLSTVPQVCAPQPLGGACKNAQTSLDPSSGGTRHSPTLCTHQVTLRATPRRCRRCLPLPRRPRQRLAREAAPRPPPSASGAAKRAACAAQSVRALSPCSPPHQLRRRRRCLSLQRRKQIRSLPPWLTRPSSRTACLSGARCLVVAATGRLRRSSGSGT